MNRIAKTVLAAAALAPALAGALAAAPLRPSLSPASSLWLEGKSTLHPFKVTATKIDVDMSLEGEAHGGLAAAALAAAPAKLTLTIPVAGMKSEHSGLEKNMRKAMKADKYPDIVFSLERYAVAAEGSKTRVTASGTLTIAGTSKPVQLSADMAERAGALVVDGEQPVKMTDYGIQPPSMMLGAVKTADEVRIKYHLELAAGK